MVPCRGISPFDAETTWDNSTKFHCWETSLLKSGYLIFKEIFVQECPLLLMGILLIETFGGFICGKE